MKDGLDSGTKINQTTSALAVDKIIPYYFQNNMSFYSGVIEVPVYDPPLAIANSLIFPKTWATVKKIITHITTIWSKIRILIEISNS